MKRFARAGTVLLFLAFPAAAAAQVPAHTPGDWKRADTEHFLFLYPDDLSGWALHMAARMEAVHAAVTELVGYAPEDRVTVLVDDPGNVSNGSMNPGPLLYMWPTPPNPRSVIGENRGWGEILAVHEFAHAAHLTRPSRNPVERFLTSLIPIPVSRLMLTTPRWATEGYATLIEGRLTGSGRPHGVWRPAILRTWALEGQIPTYGEVSGSDEFLGGSMAYLVGSAYLEWLLEREGADDERLADVWRRLTARQKRSFDEAFTGVFGAPPGELYGLFSVDLTERALAVRGAVEAAGGVVDGELFQRLTWTVGDPAVSPDGARLAVRLTSRDGPSRLVVMRTTPDTLTTEARERYEEIFAADPEDVEPVRRRPRPQEKLATLYSALGRAYSAPAWMPDGQGILVVRSDLEENVRARPDLFLWRWESGELRRVTRGAAIREAAPAPDGSWAVGVRCLHGLCDLVRIELDDGALVPLTDTDPLRPYYHPRVSPDGETIVASVQTEDGWRLVALEADGFGERVLGPDDGAARFDAEFLDDGRLLVTSTRGGIHDIEIVDPATGAVVPVTRAVGAAVAPTTARAPAADSLADIFFLSLHSRGWDLRRIARDRRPATPIVMTEPRLSPAATVPLGAVDTFPVASLGEPRPYGLGPRFRIVLPMVHLAQDGYGGGLAVGGTDPIGRLSWQPQAAYGSDTAPAGGAFRLRYRGIRPW
ncbi:MAG: TolB family protein, partial [Gemmatimonadota bacterium]